jgi:hypothetical protein
MNICNIQNGVKRPLDDVDRPCVRSVAQDAGKLPGERAILAFVSAGLRVAVAESPEAIREAGGLVHRRYAWRGYDTETVNENRGADLGTRVSQEITFVAADSNSTVGTLTLGLDGPLGLRAEETHAGVIDTTRAAGGRVCELTRLAVAEKVDSKPVLASLFSHAYSTGLADHGVTDVFIEVNPRHVAFYSRVLGFVVAASEGFCERVRAPSVLLHIEVEALAGRLEALAQRAFAQSILVEAA